MKMNLANKITMMRVLLIPLFVLFMLVDITGEADKWIALSLFVIASLTDLVDGRIARKYHMVTDFGKFMDPLADKLLVGSAMICLTTPELLSDSAIPAWIVVIIIAREFIISGFRLIAAEKGVVIAASWWGKWKTTFQMTMVIMKIADIPQLVILTNIVMYVAMALTVISLIDYMVKNRSVMGGDI